MTKHVSQYCRQLRTIAENNVNFSTYRRRGQFLIENEHCFKVSKLVNNTQKYECDYNAAAAIEYIFKFISYDQQRLLPINITVVLKKGYACLEEAICVDIQKIIVNKHVFIETCDCGTTQLTDIPLFLKICNITFLLRAIINFKPPHFRSGIGHYTCIVRRIDGSWEVFDDFNKSTCTILKTSTVEPHVLMYTI